MTDVAAKQAVVSYRPDIDGLRAVAVLAVLAFHLSVPFVSGGFVGVDVFFVISGFLITGQISRSLEKREFRFATFYLRRLRRLAPALLVMTGLCSTLAFCLLPPLQLATFAESVFAQPLAWQNFHFLADGNYFQAGHTKPLLHTWSLGVEEQFYLLWPLCLLALTRLRFSLRVPLVLGLCVLSFGLCQWLPRVSGKADFYLLPARAWELCLGGAMALATTKSRTLMTSNWLQGFALLGLLATMLAIAPGAHFPGWVALLPVVATLLLLPQGTDGPGRVQQWLSAPWLVHIGRVSYSLYLWHWPLIVFAQYIPWSVEKPWVRVAVCLFSFLAAEVSYRLVEQPIRQRRLLATNRQLLTALASVSLLLWGFAVGVLKTEGASFRYPARARALLTASFRSDTRRCGFAFRVLHPQAAACSLFAPPALPDLPGGVLLWGNSHADMWSELFRSLGESHNTPVYLNARNCRPTLDNRFCAGEQKKLLRFIDQQKIERVVLAATWYGAKGRSDHDFETELEQLIAQLDELGVKTWFVLDVPRSDEFNPIHRYKQSPQAPTFGLLPLALFQAQGHQKELNLAERLGARYSQLRIIDPSAPLCLSIAGSEPLGCRGGRDFSSWYRDSHHLTWAGAALARPLFLPVFVPLLKSGS